MTESARWSPPRRRAPWRGVLWVLLLVPPLVAAAPLATGAWDPPWLRVAGPPTFDLSTRPRLEAPALPAPFSAEGEEAGLAWRVEAASVVPRGDDPRVHDLAAPVLVLTSEGGERLEVAAARARLRLPDPEDGAPRVVRLDLDGDVRVAGGGLALTTRRLVLVVDRSRPALEVQVEAPDPVRVEAPATAGRGAWTARAAGLDGRVVPLDLRLRGPVEVAGDAPAAAPDDLAGRPLVARAAAGRLTGSAGPAARHLQRGLALPGAARLVLERVAVDVDGGRAEAVARRVTLEGARAPVAARAALGGAAGAGRGVEVAAGEAEWAVTGARAEGAVRARAGGGTTGAPLRRLEADGVDLAGDGTVRAAGAPAQVEGGAAWLAAPALRAARRGRALDVRAEGGARFGATVAAATTVVVTGAAREVRATLLRPADAAAVGTGAADAAAVGTGAADAAAVGTAARALAALGALDLVGDAGAPVTLSAGEGARLEAPQVTWRAGAGGGPGRLRLAGPVVARALEDPAPAARDPGPWTARAAAVDVLVDPALLGGLGAGASLEDLLAASPRARVDGLDLARGGPPRRQVGLAAGRLAWSRALGRASLSEGVRARLGEATLRAPRAWFDPRTRWVEAEGGVEAQVVVRAGPAPAGPAPAGPAPASVVVVTGARARARLATDPAVWAADAAARVAARRLGGRLVRPRGLEALVVEGGAGGRVRAVGADGLAAEADRVALDGDLLALEAAPGGPPVEVRARQGRVSARRVDARLGRLGPRAWARVVAAGDVEVEGDLGGAGGGGPGPLSLRAAWVAADVVEPAARPRRRGSPARPARPEADGWPVGPFAAGGPGGVVVRSTDPGPGAAGRTREALELRAAALHGDGAGRRLVLVGGDTPVVVARGAARLEAPGAELAWDEEVPAEGGAPAAGGAPARAPATGRARVALTAPWRATLERRAGPLTARGDGPLALALDLAAARAADGGGAVSVDAAWRALRALDARGGLEVDGPRLRARADAATLRDGEVVLTGDPVEVVRGGLRSRSREQVLRVDD